VPASLARDHPATVSAAAGEQGPGQSRIPQGFAKADDLAVRVENPPAHPTEGAVVEIGEMILADIADEALAYPPGSLLVAELAALKEAQAETSRRREPARPRPGQVSLSVGAAAH